MQARALRDRLLNAKTSEVPIIVEDMVPYRRWLNPLLRDANHEAEVKQDAPKQLHTSLALLPVDPKQVTYLYSRLLDAEPNDVAVIRDALAQSGNELVEQLWNAVELPRGKESQRLRAAAALASYDKDNPRWSIV